MAFLFLPSLDSFVRLTNMAINALPNVYDCKLEKLKQRHRGGGTGEWKNIASIMHSILVGIIYFHVLPPPSDDIIHFVIDGKNDRDYDSIVT